MDKKLYSDNPVWDDNKTLYYVKGYEINYNDRTKSTSASSSEFLNSVFEKSFSSKEKPKKTFNEQVTYALKPEEIRERCRIAYECRNNQICIEGHYVQKK